MKHQKGQVLLIVVMLLATAVTVTLAVSFRGTTDTKLTKLEEENQKALAAAEAGIEAALQKGTIADISTLNVPSGFTGSAQIDTTKKPFFVSTPLQKDAQYTVYLSTPGGTADNPNFNSLTTGYTNQDLMVCFGSSSSSPAIELTLVKQAGNLKKFAVNPSTSTVVSNAAAATAALAGDSDCPTDETPFTNKYKINSADIGTTGLLLIARIISPSAITTKVGFKNLSGVNLPLQGKAVVSTANSTAGVSRKVQLFQSYPQLSAEFFVTSF